MKTFKYRINTVLLTLYLFLIVFSFIFLFVTDKTVVMCILAPVLIAGLWFLSDRILYMISKVEFNAAGVKNIRPVTVFLVSSVGSLIILGIWFAGYLPGSFQGDCINQVGQALSGTYKDWHPVWHTVLFYTIPLKITGGRLWSMTFFQMVWFSLMMGYLVTAIYEYRGIGCGTVVWIYIMLNPYTGQMLLYPWKDNAFTIAGALAFIMAFKIRFSDGKWADNIWKCVTLGFALSSCTIFRHNAVLLTVPLTIALTFFVSKKSWGVIVLSFILTFALIKGPVYSFLDVEHTPQSVVQSVGLPMAVIGNVVIETPELLDEEIAEFAYDIADRSQWEKEYELGNFGVMKYYGDINLQPIEDAGTISVFRMALKCLIRSPKAGFKALFALTDIVYGIDIKDEGYIGSQITKNDYGIIYGGNGKIADILLAYYKLVRLHGFNYFRQFAFAILSFITVILAKCDLKKVDDRKLMGLCAGIIIYSFGTMLLLTSADSRFFYIDYLLCPLAILMIIPAGRKLSG